MPGVSDCINNTRNMVLELVRVRIGVWGGLPGAEMRSRLPCRASRSQDPCVGLRDTNEGPTFNMEAMLKLRIGADSGWLAFPGSGL
jgi:hypothetical protein